MDVKILEVTLNHKDNSWAKVKIDSLYSEKGRQILLFFVSAKYFARVFALSRIFSAMEWSGVKNCHPYICHTIDRERTNERTNERTVVSSSSSCSENASNKSKNAADGKKKESNSRRWYKNSFPRTGYFF